MTLDDNMSAPAETESADDLVTQLDRIADQLATLAAVEDCPSGVLPSQDQFEADEVDFESGGWLLRVLQVQGWMHLDEDLDAAAAARAPDMAATQLFQAIGTSNAADCFQSADGFPRLTGSGAEALATRLDAAQHLQAAFIEFRETLNRRQATERWNEQWEEEQIADVELEPIRAKTAIWPIQEFSDKAKKGKLNLRPSYQRSDVWPTDHCQKLMISILRGIPLPSIILLKPRDKFSGGVYEVVDGKQRLTSILRFIGKHPEALVAAKRASDLHPQIGFEDLFATNYRKFRRLWEKNMGERLTAKREAEYYFPFRLPTGGSEKKTPLDEVLGKYFYEIRDVQIPGGTENETVGDVFETVSEYKIPVIEYTEATPRQVHEVFHLYNRQGKHLNAEEIRNALFHEVKLMTLLLVASGDNDEVERLVHYLPTDKRAELKRIADALTGFRFGTARYRRTKLLSWLTALVLQPSLQPDGALSVRSTAKQIDDMLSPIRQAIEEGTASSLEDTVRLGNLVDDLHQCLDVHSSCLGWADEFKDDKNGSKWQELQLVASLVGVFLVCAVVTDPAELLERHNEELLSFTAGHLRPEKTQNKTQWAFIGKVALGIVEVAGIQLDELQGKLEARYGQSCLATLQAAALHYKPRQKE